MKQFKIKSKIDRLDGSGLVDHTLYVKATDSEEARISAKRYYISEKGWILESSENPVEL